MASNRNSDGDQDGAHGANTSGTPDKSADTPDWANGLKQLYDSVVEEPLPDSFLDLLSQLDDPDGSEKGQRQ